MPVARINDAAQVSRELAEGLARHKTSRQAALQAAMTLTLAHAYMAEYARLLAEGKASEEALAAILEVRLDMVTSGQLMARLMFSAPDES